MARLITPETAEKKAVKDWLRIKGFFVYHNLAGLGVFKGVPDLTAISKEGVVYQIEVKAPDGRQSDNQKEFQKEWEDRGGIYILGGLEEVIKRTGEYSGDRTKLKCSTCGEKVERTNFYPKVTCSKCKRIAMRNRYKKK